MMGWRTALSIAPDAYGSIARQPYLAYPYVRLSANRARRSRAHAAGLADSGERDGLASAVLVGQEVWRAIARINLVAYPYPYHSQITAAA